MGLRMGQPAAQSIMMQLGSFQFCIATAAYQELTRRTEYRWPSQDRFGQLPALQFTGPGQESITLNGVIYPEFVGSLTMIARMRILAGRGQPLPLVSGAGLAMGRWCIESVEEKQGTFTIDGAPRRQDFTLQLKLFDGRQAEQDGILAAIGAATRGVAGSSRPGLFESNSPIGRVIASATGYASNAARAASDIVSTATGALTAVQERADQISSVVGPILAGVQTTIGTAQAIQGTIATLRANIRNAQSFGDIASIVESVSSAASAASVAGSLASQAISVLLPDLAAEGVPSDTMQVLKDCQATCGRAAVSASAIQSQGITLINDARSILDND